MDTDTYAEFFVRAFKNGALSHAYLFSGNDQKLKEAVVSEILSQLKCSEGDIFRIKPDGEIAISKIRELRQKLSFAPWSSPFKTAVIEGADAMNYEAQGALLRALEEPKGRTVFFLLTSHPFALLPTIRSRVQEMRFWKFDQANLSDKTNRTNRSYHSDLPRLMRANIGERLEYAKTLSESEKDIMGILEEWLSYLRFLLLDSRISSQAVKLAQETVMLLKTTNVNKRLALERILLIV